MKTATIARDPGHSPNMQTSDEAILTAIENALVVMGHNVERIGEQEIDATRYDAICHMSRTQTVLEKLKTAEKCGCKVLNSPMAVEQCSRLQFMNILRDNGIPQPEFHILHTTDSLNGIHYPGWIKKGEGWSCRKEDIVYVTNEKEAKEAIGKIADEKNCALFCNHAEGDIIKFYGVGNDFFTYTYPDPEKTKFGWEKINGKPQRYPFDENRLHDTAFSAARAIGLTIFGGDAVINGKGDIAIIDINDFPSFSPVRQEAARHIAKMIDNIEKP